MAIWYNGGALLVHAGSNFDMIVRYYSQFGAEPAAASDTFIEVSPNGSREPKYGPSLVRFSHFLELIQGLTAVAARGYAVLVNHGMSDSDGHPLGLVLELTGTPSPYRVDEYVLGLLAGFMDKPPAAGDFATAEKQSRVGAANTPIPPGTLKPLHEALTILRGKQLQRLEIRACNLGGNPTVMRLLRKVLGVTDVISAPDVHMFYVTAGLANTLPMSTAGFDKWRTAHGTGRVFTDATKRKPGRYGLQILGHGPQRSTNYAADTVDISWFADQHIMWGHYPPPPPGAKLIPPLLVAGMDSGNSYALPLEPDYRRHIVDF